MLVAIFSRATSSPSGWTSAVSTACVCRYPYCTYQLAITNRRTPLTHRSRHPCVLCPARQGAERKLMQNCDSFSERDGFGGTFLGRFSVSVYEPVWLRLASVVCYSCYLCRWHGAVWCPYVGKRNYWICSWNNIESSSSDRADDLGLVGLARFCWYLRSSGNTVPPILAQKFENATWYV